MSKKTKAYHAARRARWANDRYVSPVKTKPREAAWLAYRLAGKRYK